MEIKKSKTRKNKPTTSQAEEVTQKIRLRNLVKKTTAEKEENPPIILQLRPVQDIWVNLKLRVDVNNFRPKNTQFFIKKTQEELKI